MKRTLFLLAAALILGAVYIFIIQKNDNKLSSVEISDRDFVIEDKDDVHVITIKSKGYPLIHLAREGETWILNQKYRASNHIVNNMLSVLSGMEINYIPPSSQEEMIRKSVAATGIDIKAYDKKGRILTGFVLAGNTNAEDGTYVIKNGATQAYVMRMPVVEGGLRNYFTHDINALRDKTVFDFDPDRIRAVALHYPKDKRNSFSISREGGTYVLRDNAGNTIDKADINPNTLRSYIREFEELQSEYISNDNPAIDSIAQRIPFARIEIDTKKNGSYWIELFPDIDIYDSSINTLSIESPDTPERYFVKTNWSDHYIIQHRLIAPLLKTPSYFRKR